MRTLAVLNAALVLSLAGCTGSIPEGRFSCTSNSDCPTDWRCRPDGFCYSMDGGPGVDAGPIDAGPIDGGPIDGGPIDGGPPRDTGVTDAGSTCENNGQCADGMFCNGSERCDPPAPGADAFGCVGGTAIVCSAGEVCDEIADACAPACSTDMDSDGSISMACGGDDCDDDNPTNFPGNPEVCDGRDNDCDDQIDADTCLAEACGAGPDPIAPAMLPICTAATQAGVRACPAADPTCIGAVVDADPAPLLCGFCSTWQIGVCASRLGCDAEYATFACCWMTRGCAPGDFDCVDLRCPEAFAQWFQCTVVTTPQCWDPDMSFFRQCFP